MKEKHLILLAKILSMVFAPFYLPLVGLIILLLFTYLSLLPWLYKLVLLAVVYIFTIFLPTMLIRLYQKWGGWTHHEMGKRERRVVPYAISILCYLICQYLMSAAHVPHIIISVVLAALVIQCVCYIVNIFFKISIHTAAIGGVAGAIMAFSNIFSFNPVWWVNVTFVVAGLVGTSRMVLRQHSLHEVVYGFLLGALCSFASVMLY